MSHCSSFIKRAYNIIRNDAGIDGDAQRIEKIARMFFFCQVDAAKEQEREREGDNDRSIIPGAFRWQHRAHDEKSGYALTSNKLLVL